MGDTGFARGTARHKPQARQNQPSKLPAKEPSASATRPTPDPEAAASGHGEHPEGPDASEPSPGQSQGKETSQENSNTGLTGGRSDSPAEGSFSISQVLLLIGTVIAALLL